VRRFPLEDVSAISLSKRLPTLNSTLLHFSFSRQTDSVHSCRSYPYESRYYRVTMLVVLPDYQGIGVGKRFLNFVAELYTSQTKIPFYILTSNPQIIRGNMKNWKITRFGHASKRRGNTRINNEIRDSLSRKRITVSLEYIPKFTTQLAH